LFKWPKNSTFVTSMRQTTLLIVLLTAHLAVLAATVDSLMLIPKADIMEDVFSALSEDDITYKEDLHQRLTDLMEHPLNLNTATYDQLSELMFLSAEQINALLLYRDRHPFVSLSELKLLDCLKPYEVRNLCAFVWAGPTAEQERLYAREMLQHAQHELTLRTDCRNIEDYDGDPVYAQLRYRMNYHDRIQLGLTLRRPTGAAARDMLYGAYVQLNDFGPLHTLVVGDMQAQFGQGLVLSGPFHQGKSTYVLSAGMASEGLKKYSSPDGEGLHGVGATFRVKGWDVSALYSLTAWNDSTRRHTLGANVSYRHKQWKVGLTMVENLYSDSVRYYYDQAYNRNYFRGKQQAVVGVNGRYNFGRWDLWAEVAAAQNTRWGWAATAGVRVVPASDIGLMLLYRYYSPTYDNPLGYAFAETGRINDEQGLYLGLEIKRMRHWRWALYGDAFHFTGEKYGIHYAPSWGYDTQLEAGYYPERAYNMYWRLRAKGKGGENSCIIRYQCNWNQGGWHLRTEADGNMFRSTSGNWTGGASVYQDVHYSFAKVPLTLQLRLQGFYAPNWDNRIYIYEYDVLNAYSCPATYGTGGRAYVNLRWRIVNELTLYLRVSETVYAKKWAMEHDRPMTRTDIHLLLRAKL